MNPVKYVETAIYIVLTVAFVGAAAYWAITYLLPSMVAKTVGNVPLPVLYGIALGLLVVLGWLSRAKKKDE